MHNWLVRRAVRSALIGIALAVALAACSSDVSGNGRPNVVASSSSSGPSSAAGGGAPDQPTRTVAPQVPTVTVTAAAPSASTTSISSAPTSASSTASTSYVPPPLDTSPPLVQAGMGTIDARTYCKSHTDTAGTAVVQWKAVNATHVYILEGQRAISSTDARADGALQYPYNGSATLHFDCSGPYDYFRFDAYNNEGHSGLLVTIHYNA
jgi:hypothetical protein